MRKIKDFVIVLYDSYFCQIMERVEGLLEDFEDAKVVYLTTLNREGEKTTRPMTNFNESPYSVMWFPTFTASRKVEDISENADVSIFVPSKSEGEFWEIEGVAEFGSLNEVRDRWRWWYLFWNPDVRREMNPEDWKWPENQKRMIKVNPKSVRLVKAEEVDITE